MVGHGGSSAGSYLADPTSPSPSHCAVIILFKIKCPSASIVVSSTLRVKQCTFSFILWATFYDMSVLLFQASDLHRHLRIEHSVPRPVFHSAHLPGSGLYSLQYGELCSNGITVLGWHYTGVWDIGDGSRFGPNGGSCLRWCIIWGKFA